MDALKACPRCGKKEGKIVHRPGAKFPYYVTCSTCGWSTEFVKLEPVAVKLWNGAEKK